jgi:ABC-type antimicrobial peptide transport system permease subunit
VYFPYAHANDKNALLGWPGSLRFEVRASGDPAALVQSVRKVIVGFDSELPIDGIDPLRTLMRQSILQQRLVAQLATSFGILALLLAGIGLYGVMTYAVTRRTAEIGLRVALGAQQAAVVRMVVFEALRLVALGVIVGLPLALLGVRLMVTQLHGIAAVDLPSIAAAVLVLTTSAVVAVLIPATRAANVSPIAALRSE